MCLAVPAKVLEINGDKAKVDYGGVTRDVNVSLVDVKVGEYVIVHAGYAIQTMDEEDANITLDYWRQILEHDAEEMNKAKEAKETEETASKGE